MKTLEWKMCDADLPLNFLLFFSFLVFFVCESLQNGGWPDRRLLTLLVSDGGYFLFPLLLECVPYADHNHRHVCSSVIS